MYTETITVDAVGRILDAVAQQEQRLVQMLHVRRLEEIRWLGRIEKLFQLREIPEDARWVTIRMPVHLCDAVGTAILIGLFDSLDESELTPCRHPYSPAQQQLPPLPISSTVTGL